MKEKRSRLVALATEEPQDLETRLLQQDIERMQERQNSQRLSEAGRSSSAQEQSSPSGPKELLDKVLIADFFFVCVALLWLAAGVAEKAAANSTRLLDVWFPLWNAVFQPAIGVLMLGALTSGALGWLNREKK